MGLHSSAHHSDHLRQTMQIFVRQVSGSLSTLSVSDEQTVGALRATVATREDVSVEDLRLSANGLELTDEMVLASCLSDNATLDAMLRLRGGGKKRKKKNFLKPKRIPHKHKNVPLATLKYYKIDSQGKIMRLRQECKHPMCGPGVFMANHFDRHYCGKCFVTFKYDSAEANE